MKNILVGRFQRAWRKYMAKTAQDGPVGKISINRDQRRVMLGLTMKGITINNIAVERAKKIMIAFIFDLGKINRFRVRIKQFWDRCQFIQLKFKKYHENHSDRMNILMNTLTAEA